MSGFSTNLAPSKKANSLADDVPIYYYGGHGEDICDPITHELRMDTVPENCIYITIGECGLTTSTYNIRKFLTIFRDPSEKARTLLRFPYLFQNLLEISKQTEISLNSIHVHLPGSTYVVSKISPPLSWDSVLTDTSPTGHFGMFFSGISEKKLLEQVPASVNSILTPKVRANLPAGSLMKLDESEPRKDLFSKLQRLFASDPQVSRLLNQKGAEALLNGLFGWKDSLSRYDINRYLDELGYSISTQTFLDLYQASVFPSHSAVRKIVEEKTTGLKDGFLYGFDITYISYLLNKNVRENDFSVSEIMRKYPGIHYNVVCRVLAYECTAVEPSIRRAVSYEEEQQRRGRIFSPFERFETEKNKLRFETITDIDIVLNFIKVNKDFMLTLPNEQLKELFSKIGLSLTIDVLNEKGLELFTSIYALLYPLKDIYSLRELKDDLARDIDIMKSSYSFMNRTIQPSLMSNLYSSMVSNRANHYVSHLNKESIHTISQDEKKTVISSIEIYLSEEQAEAFENLLIPNQTRFYSSGKEFKKPGTITDQTIIVSYITEYKDNILQSPYYTQKNVLMEIGISLERNFRNQQGNTIFITIYTLLYPLNDSYSLREIMENVLRDKELGMTLKKYTPPKNLEAAYSSFLSTRLKEYISRINKESIRDITTEEISKFIKKELKNHFHDDVYKLFLNLFGDVPMVAAIPVPPPSPARPPVPIHTSTQPQSQQKGIAGNPQYTLVIARVNEILERSYPKAKDTRELLYIKQGAVYNILQRMINSLAKLSTNEKKSLITFLGSNQIIRMDAKEPMISKRIKHIIMPETYPNPQARGGTRKKSSTTKSVRAKRTTRKR